MIRCLSRILLREIFSVNTHTHTHICKRAKIFLAIFYLRTEKIPDVKCPKPPVGSTVEVVNLKHLYYPGDTVTYQCRYGRQLWSGNLVRTCTNKGV